LSTNYKAFQHAPYLGMPPGLLGGHDHGGYPYASAQAPTPLPRGMQALPGHSAMGMMGSPHAMGMTGKTFFVPSTLLHAYHHTCTESPRKCFRCPCSTLSHTLITSHQRSTLPACPLPPKHAAAVHSIFLLAIAVVIIFEISVPTLASLPWPRLPCTSTVPIPACLPSYGSL
jgi:hypothetical protein